MNPEHNELASIIDMGARSSQYTCQTAKQVEQQERSLMDQGTLAVHGAVMITGATGGIGSAIANLLVSRGIPVSLLDLAAPSNSVTDAASLGAQSASVLCHVGDAASRADAEAWLTATVDTFGSVAGLVNVAGIFLSKPVLELDDDDLAQTLSANLLTTIVCSQVVGRRMVDAQAGSIVNIASTAGEYGSISPAAHYAAAKGGVIAFTKSLAREYSPFGVRVNAVSPGPIDTTGRSLGSRESDTSVAGRSLLRRMGQPSEIADAVAFLLGNESTFITGHILRVNGGALI